MNNVVIESIHKIELHRSEALRFYTARIWYQQPAFEEDYVETKMHLEHLIGKLLPILPNWNMGSIASAILLIDNVNAVEVTMGNVGREGIVLYKDWP